MRNIAKSMIGIGPKSRVPTMIRLSSQGHAPRSRSTTGGHAREQRALLDQERRQDPRSGEVPDEERQPMALRHEGASQGRQPIEADPCGGGDAGQRRPQQGAARSAARQRDEGVGRPGLSRPKDGDQGAGTRGHGPHQSPIPSPRRRGRDGAGEEPYEVEGPRQGRRILSASSSGCSASPSYATVDWPTCSSPAGICYTASPTRLQTAQHYPTAGRDASALLTQPTTPCAELP